MARLDPAIERLFAEAGQRIVFISGTSAVLWVGDNQRPVFRQPLNAQQIIGAFSEMAPEEMRTRFPLEGTTRFRYASPSGAVDVVFDKKGGEVQAEITRAPKAPAEQSLPPGKVMFEKVFADRPSSASKKKTEEAPRVIVEKRVFRRGEPLDAMRELLEYMVEQRASDLHLTSTCVPMLRIDGDITPVTDYGEITPERLKDLLYAIMPERNREEWEKIKDSDLAYEWGPARYRVNVFADRMGIGAVIRQIPTKILTAEDLGLSQAILNLCKLNKGLVVVTGPTGSGKSTTLAAMVDHINRTRSDHIITIEDPVEFVHPNKRCLVNQREVGVNTSSFKHALRAALREDPDIVLVGEMRDLETMAIAIETAETGHLVFGTLHTTTAASTVDRMIDQFPADRQPQIRLMLSESLKGVVAQTLCKKIGGGRVAALEVLLVNNAVANLIREGKTFQIPSIMQTARGQGMITLNDALLDLVRRKLVTADEAYLKAVQKSELKTLLEQAGFQLTPPGQ